MTDGGTPQVTTFDEVLSVLRDPVSFTLEGDALECGQRRPLIPLQSGPSEHAVHRALVGDALNRAATAVLEPTVRQRANELIDDFADERDVDVNARYSRLIPVVVLLDLLGLPLTDAEVIRGFHDGILQNTDAAALATRDRIAAEVYDYFGPVVAARRTDIDGGDDLIRCLQRSRTDGWSLSDDQIVDVCFLLVLAGVDPAGNAIACGAGLLAQRPELRAQLDRNPSLWRRTIEELLRWGSVVAAIARVATTDAVIGDQAIAAGQRVGCGLAVANRDASVFPHPNEFDPSRPLRTHLAFGAGPHHCIGAHLARTQVQVALQELQSRFPDYRLDPAGPPRLDAATLRSTDPLRLTLR